ncbi:MAG: hypothetical protein M1819_006949 [Sarea resinae]|nr:MAG: hypothetical protein M1819_006949 [Sarea resinae]
MAAAFPNDNNAAAINLNANQLPIESWFYSLPPCTRLWTTATVLTSLAVQAHLITPWQLFYSFRAVYQKSQFWRPLTTFLYFGPLSLDLLFHVFFMQRYARLLEESSGSPAEFAWLLLYACAVLVALSPLLSMPFLGPALSNSLVYIWARRNPETRLSFLGVLVFTAPYLPWVLMGFSLMLHGTVPKDEILYYFFTDVYPSLHNNQRPLAPPSWFRRLFEGRRPRAEEQDVDGAGEETDAGGIHNDIAAAAAGDVR